jgi:glucose/arabinose dehydrogenase
MSPPAPEVVAEMRACGVYGRPADLLIMPDGSLLVSDDRAGAIYRIRYTSK